MWSWKRGETGLGAVVEDVRGWAVVEWVEREELCRGLTGEMMLDGWTEEMVEDLDWLTVERGDLDGFVAEMSDSGGRAPDAIVFGEFLLARALSAMAHFICSSSLGTRRDSVLGSYRP